MRGENWLAVIFGSPGNPHFPGGFSRPWGAPWSGAAHNMGCGFDCLGHRRDADLLWKKFHVSFFSWSPGTFVRFTFIRNRNLILLHWVYYYYAVQPLLREHCVNVWCEQIEASNPARCIVAWIEELKFCTSMCISGGGG